MPRTSRSDPRDAPRRPWRLIVVSGDQWPRALLRAELRHAGYDAIGAKTLAEVLRYPAQDAERGPVRLLVVERSAATADRAALDRARRRYAKARFVLVQGGGAAPPGPWAATLRRPLAIGDVVTRVRRLLPPPRGAT